jgi:hypothetical protein
MATWTTGEAGWAVMLPSGEFVGVYGCSWEPEGACNYGSREEARKAASARGGRVVRLLRNEAFAEVMG